VVIVLFDIYEGVTHRDLTIVGDLIKLKLPLIIAVNKIDTLPPHEFKRRFNMIVKALHFAKWIPIIPISAKTGK
jgi:predicted GTPase